MPEYEIRYSSSASQQIADIENSPQGQLIARTLRAYGQPPSQVTPRCLPRVRLCPA